MATVKAANVTKYTATGSEGSGDNYIADGYIKSVEKVWIDSYTLNAVIPSTTSIHIGKVPKGKKLTDIIVYYPALGPATTVGTINCGTATVHNSGTEGNLGFLFGDKNVKNPQSINLASAGMARLGPTGALVELTADTDIYILIDPANSLTACTIRSIIKYT